MERNQSSRERVGRKGVKCQTYIKVGIVLMKQGLDLAKAGCHVNKN